jgi:CHAT domain-containing protein/tetratricopeptide (TPR) repeat protein
MNCSRPLLRWLKQGFIGVVSGTWIVTPGITLPQAAFPIQISKPLLIAQASTSVSPVSITGRLDQNSPTLPDGSHYQEHTFEGRAGDQIAIELSSDEFDAYLILKSPDGKVIAQNDNGVSGINSTIVITLPTTGVYIILANTYGAGATGSYQLERRVATETDQTLAEALAEATQLNQRANELLRAGRYEEAIPFAERSIAIREQALGENHPLVAQSLNSLAELYRAQGNYAQAEPLFQRSLVIVEQSLGANHPDVAASLNNLAALYQAQGNYAQAEPLFQRSLVIVEQSLGANHPDVATVLNNLASLYKAQGNYAQAEPLLQRSLAIREQALGENHPDVSQSLNNLAGLYQAQGNYTQAEPLYQRSLAIWEQALGENHPAVATSLNNLALLYQEEGNYAQAEPLFQQSLAIREQALGENHPDIATSLNNLAVLYQEQGNYAQAGPFFQQSLAILEQSLGGNHPDTASSLNNLAELYRDQGNYAQAEPLYRRSLSIREQALGENHPAIAESLNNLAELYRAQGSYAQAEAFYQRSLAIWEQSLGANHPAVAGSLYNLASLYQDQGSYAQAEAFYQRSLAIWEQSLGENHPDVALSLNGLATLYLAQSNYTQAEPLFQRSLAIWEQSLGTNHPDAASSLNNLANLYQNQGNYALAEPLYRRSLAIWEQSLGAYHPNVAGSLNNLATLSWVQNDLASTLNLLWESLLVEEVNLNLNLVAGSESYKRNFLATFVGTTDIVISLHLQALSDSSSAAQLALTTILQRKGRILDLFTNSQQILREQLDPDSQALLNNLSAKRNQLSALVFNRPESLTLDQYRNQVAALESQIQPLEDQLSRRSSQFRALNQPIDIPTIQALLPDQTTLVELVRYRIFDPKAASNNFGEARYAAYLLQANGRIDGIDLGSVAEIDPLISDLQRSLRNPSFTIDEVKEASRALDARVMAPIRQRLGDTNHIILSPDGAFNLIPFEALVDESGRYLVENFTLTYLTSGRDLLRLQATAASQTEPMLLANPIFERAGDPAVAQAPTRYADLRQQNWTALSGTAEEANAIAAQFPHVLNLQGSAATEAALKQANRPRFLHIATHGFFEPVDPSEVVPIGNPLLRSGLVLSGLKVGESGTGEDGIVSAVEVSSLNLLGTQLVVLSACETGLGDLSLGEGVYGLRRALVLSGSQSQLISLWRVQDDTTRDLMVDYYHHLLSGMGRSEALRQTQLAMLSNEATAHPYYWAAFINSGDWQPISPQ